MAKARVRKETVSPATRLFGLALGLMSFYIAICLISYHPADPSLNRSTEAPASNWAGYAGALTADLLLQVMGLASLLAVFIPLAWSFKIFIGQRISYLWRRTAG